MKSSAKVIMWQDGEADRTKEYFEFQFGSIPAALVGPPLDGILNVQFLLDSGDPGNADALKKVKKEIEFYFLELNERNPWLYAQWSFFSSQP